MKLLSVFAFLAKNWGLISEVLALGVAAVTTQNDRTVANSTKRNAAFSAMREALPSYIGDMWINLGIELSLALLRWRNVL